MPTFTKKASDFGDFGTPSDFGDFGTTSDFRKIPSDYQKFSHSQRLSHTCMFKETIFLLYIRPMIHLFQNSKISRSKPFSCVYDTIY